MQKIVSKKRNFIGGTHRHIFRKIVKEKHKKSAGQAEKNAGELFERSAKNSAEMKEKNAGEFSVRGAKAWAGDANDIHKKFPEKVSGDPLCLTYAGMHADIHGVQLPIGPVCGVDQLRGVPLPASFQLPSSDRSYASVGIGGTGVARTGRNSEFFAQCNVETMVPKSEKNSESVAETIASAGVLGCRKKSEFAAVVIADGMESGSGLIPEYYVGKTAATVPSFADKKLGISAEKNGDESVLPVGKKIAIFCRKIRRKSRIQAPKKNSEFCWVRGTQKRKRLGIFSRKKYEWIGVYAR